MNTTLGSDSSGSPAVVALIPAHNEERTIVESITSLLDQQGINLLKVIVVADNCTDETAKRALALRIDHPNLEVIESQNNSAGKPGALNQGFLHLLEQPADYILQMDSDTILKVSCLNNAVRLLEANPTMGGVCARFKLISPPSDACWMSKMLWQFQNVEFWFDDTSAISSFGKDPRLLSGRVSAFRYESLVSIYEERGFVWDEKTSVEDKAITLDLKQRQWEVAIGMKMHAWTSAPLTVPEYIRQRLRWNRGSIALLGRQRLSKHSRKDARDLFLACFIWFPLRLLGLAWLVLAAAGYVEYHISWVFLSMTLCFWVYTMYKLVLTSGCGFWGNLFAATIVPWEIYLLVRDLILVASLVLSVFPSTRERRTIVLLPTDAERSR